MLCCSSIPVGTIPTIPILQPVELPNRNILFEPQEIIIEQIKMQDPPLRDISISTGDKPILTPLRTPLPSFDDVLFITLTGYSEFDTEERMSVFNPFIYPLTIMVNKKLVEIPALEARSWLPDKNVCKECGQIFLTTTDECNHVSNEVSSNTKEVSSLFSTLLSRLF